MGGILPYQKIIGSGLIIGVPTLGTDDHSGCFQAASYDLRVGQIIAEKEVITGDQANPYYLPSGGMVTLLTQEKLSLTDKVAAIVFPPNKLAEQGLLVLNPGHIDPGYEGSLSVRVINLRKVDFPLRIGIKIFTCIFFDLQEPTEKPYRKREPEADRLDRLCTNASETMSRTLFETQAEQIKKIVREDLEKTFVGKDALVSQWLRAVWTNLWKVPILILVLFGVWIVVNVATFVTPGQILDWVKPDWRQQFKFVFEADKQQDATRDLDQPKLQRNKAGQREERGQAEKKNAPH